MFAYKTQGKMKDAIIDLGKELFKSAVTKPLLITKFLLVSCLILFWDPIILIYQKLIIIPILSHVKEHWSIDVSVIAFCAFMVFLMAYKCKKFKSPIFSLNTSVNFTILLAIYWITRYCNSSFYFYKLEYFSSINISDVIATSLSVMILESFSLIFWIKIKRSKEFEKSKESALTDTEHDKLNRKEFAKSIAELIGNQKNKDSSYAIGIVGRWGEGKTTLMNFVKSEVEKDSNCTIIDFNPWYSANPKTLVTDFFATMQDELKQYNPELGSLLNAYAQSLIRYYDKNNAFGSLFDQFCDQPSNLKRRFEYVKKGIQTTGRQILVCIDDMDRLDKNEIVEVIRLIRNTANFGNTVFLVTYDKAYVVAALKAINDYGSETYLEKIFQQEIPLPDYDKTYLKVKLVESISEKVGSDSKIWLEKLVYGKPFEMDPLINYHFKNTRDVLNFSNDFCLPYNNVKGDVNEESFFMLQVLLFSFPDIYNLIKEGFIPYSKYLSQINNSDGSPCIILQMDDKKESKSNTNYAILSYLEERKYSSDAINEIIRLLNRLFPYSNKSYISRQYINTDYNQIFYPNNFKKYFAFRNTELNIDKDELKSGFDSPIEELFKKIDTWVAEGKAETLGIYLKSATVFQSREQYEKLLRAIFYFANLKSPGDSRNIIEFNRDVLRKRLIYKSVKDYYRSEADFKKFVVQLLKEARDPALFASRFLDEEIKNRETYENVYGSFPLTEQEMLAQNEEYLERYLEKETTLNVEAFWLYDACYYTDGSVKNNTSQYMIDFAKQKDLENFLKFMVNHTRGGTDFYNVSGLIGFIFGGYPAFEQFLEEVKNENDYYKEFKEFYEKTKANEYKPVEFQFDALKVNRWISE